MAVKAVNDTAGPDGLVPTLLVFGTYPRLSKTSPPSPSIAAQATAVRKAMSEIRKLKAARQVQDALATRNGPNVTEVLLLPLQSDVKVWRENKGWTGPHTLLGLNLDSTAAIVDINGRPTTFRTTVVHPYHHDDGAVSPQPHEKEHDDDLNDRDDDYVPEQPPRRRRGRPKGSKNKPKSLPPALTAPAETGNAAHLAQREQDDLVLARTLRSTGKITTPGQPFEKSTQTEIDALIVRGVFQFEVYNPKIHGGVRIFKSRIVNEVKGKTTNQPYEKSRLIIQGYNDSDKALVLTQSPTIHTNLERHHNTSSGPISIKISIGIIRNHLPDTLSPFLELPRPWLWGAALLKLFCDGIFSFGVLSTGHHSQHHLISPTPTLTLALPTLEAAQLHQFEPFLLGFLVS
jgi:hypothetical protein